MFNHDAREELGKRYKMDEKIWLASQRKSFPFNFNLTQIIAISLATPVVMFFLPSSSNSINWRTTQMLLTTLVISIFAYFLAKSLINRFKDTLCSKGLFGKDLNKAGERETKEKV